MISLAAANSCIGSFFLLQIENSERRFRGSYSQEIYSKRCKHPYPRVYVLYLRVRLPKGHICQKGVWLNGLTFSFIVFTRNISGQHNSVIAPRAVSQNGIPTSNHAHDIPGSHQYPHTNKSKAVHSLNSLRKQFPSNN